MKYFKLVILFFCSYCSSQIANSVDAIIECENDNNGIEIFDLTVQNSQILGSQNPSFYTVSYYLNLSNANNDINEILNTSSYTNITNPQIIYARVTENSTGNFDTTLFELVVDTFPIIELAIQYFFCEDDNLPVVIALDYEEYFYEWFLDGILIEVGNTLTTDEIGIYKVVAIDNVTFCSSS